MKQLNLLFFFILIGIGSIGYAQESTPLSDQSFKSIRDSIIAHSGTDLIKALSASNAYIQKARQEKDLEQEWLGIEAKGLSYISAKEIAQAHQVFEELLEFSLSNDLEVELIRTYLFGAQVQANVPNINKMMEQYDKALKLAEAANNERWREVVLIRISGVLEMVGDVDKSIEIRKKTLEFYQQKELDTIYDAKAKRRSLIFMNFLLADSYLELKKIDSAEYYNKEMDRIITPEDTCSYQLIYFNKGELNYQKKNFQLAKDAYTKSMEYCSPENDLWQLNMDYRFGRIAHGEGSFNEAKRILQAGLDNYDVTEAEEGYMDDYYKLLADSYKETGGYEKANYYFEKYINTTSEMAKMQDEVHASLRNQEIAAFQEELTELETAKKKREQYLIYLSILASLVILGLLLLLLRFYRLKKANEEKFKALLAKMNQSQLTSEKIIDTKDGVVDETTTDINDDTLQHILKGLEKIEEQEYYLSQDCTSHNVAKKIKTNTSYLSKVINSHHQKNFNTYINDLRINYAVLRLKNDVFFRAFSIQSISEEVGYKSADSFTKYFKKHTGLNPSFYIKQIKNLD